MIDVMWLDAHARLGLDEATEGALMNKTYDNPYELIENMKPQDRANQNDHIVCGQFLDRIDGEIQSMRTNVKQEGKEYVKAITLRSDKILSSLEILTHERTKENAEDLQKDPQQVDEELEPKEIAKPIAELKEKSIKELPMIRIPFPSRLGEKQRLDEDKFV
ncbi:hypothetical protein EPI10_005095 [Gossypium australe]|uniref:Acidic leucine-rich nuclear phosphoprotein 32 family member B-like n=1 Tax=Gossypium australe TaxID=47621 RepID=A0A5B6WND1_9ROSI|nr:hypothetical protein EPI10_005095 [Gossypium australe]